MKTLLTYMDEDGEEMEFEAPAKYDVCAECEGTGKHVNPAVDGHGITAEEFADDPDFRDAYFAGRYDVTCYSCKGLRVHLHLDWDEAERLAKNDPELARHLEAFEEAEEWEANYAAECAAERRMGY